MRPTAEDARKRNSSHWSGDWPGAVCWSTGSARSRNAEDLSRHRTSGSRLLATSAATPRYRHAGAVAVCLSAAARQRDGAEIAARRRIVQDLRSKGCGRLGDARPPRNRSNGCVAGRFSGDRASGSAGRIAKSFSRSMLPTTTMASGRPRATTILFFGTFTIFCSMRAAPKVGTLTRWAALTRMPA